MPILRFFDGGFGDLGLPRFRVFYGVVGLLGLLGLGV